MMKNLIGILLLSLFALASCHDDENSTLSPSNVDVVSGKTEYLTLSKNEDETEEPVEEDPETGNLLTQPGMC